MSFYFEELARKAKAEGINKMKAADAMKWYRDQAKNLSDASGNKVMQSDPKRLLKTTRVGVDNIGAMLIYFYDPKTKEQLPYYDRFPCVFPIELYGDGFLGINMHYLSPFQRARLMDALYKTAQKKKTDKQRLQINYQILKGATQFRTFRPCVKRYLYSHVRSRFFIVRTKEWDTILMLPLERFEQGGAKGGKVGGGISKTKVWSESMAKVR